MLSGTIGHTPSKISSLHSANGLDFIAYFLQRRRGVSAVVVVVLVVSVNISERSENCKITARVESA